MIDHLPAGWLGAVGAVMFNLGYLPGGNKTITTQAATTLRALSQARGLLRPGGMLSVLVYRGHAGGDDESSAIDQWLDKLPNRFARETHESPGPVLHIIERRA
jgi:hypothetical protein